MKDTGSRDKNMEATAGIEPAYTALQAAASPLRHVASFDAPFGEALY